MILFILLGILEIGIILFIQKRQRNKASKTALIISSIIILNTILKYDINMKKRKFLKDKDR